MKLPIQYRGTASPASVSAEPAHMLKEYRNYGMTQPTLTQIEQAALNNAHWCNAVCRTHNAGGEFRNGLWLTHHQTPRFYPNAVTVHQAGTAAQLAAIQDLISTTTLTNLAVKDSFCTLDLAPLGFQLLFGATWLWREPTLPKPDVAVNDIRWTTVQEPSELANWESAWNGPLDDNQSAPQPRIFLPTLLADPDMRFIAAYQNEQIVAGAIAFRSDAVVGISNVFTPEDAARDFWAGCVAMTIDAFPGLPLVDYEHGNDLVIAQSLGFEDVGSLRVRAWERPID